MLLRAVDDRAPGGLRRARFHAAVLHRARRADVVDHVDVEDVEDDPA
ncbi:MULTISPECIES: hypothetical protein [Streptomyces]|nr:MULTISPECIES: hypothetical protein [Streptomyces]MYT02540.1 hypothetical protein [Streptomyces sp. SID5469]